MKIFATDQATITTGWSLFENGKYIESGTIIKKNSIPIDDRIPQMANAICRKLRDVGADLCVIENIQQQRSPKTTIELARLQGCIMMYCASKGIPLQILEPSKWRSTLGYRQGSKVAKEELKQQSVDYVSETFGIAPTTVDECEAVAIGAAASALFDTEQSDC